ncbi:MAG: FecR domain-containing protein [Verrucomicrobiales bacterium]|nr:FecR domain-containing protein [Verrucomicrobiales bacterium]
MTPQEDQLLCRYLDGKLSGEDENSLQDLLRNSGEARRRLRILATVTEGLATRSEGPALPKRTVKRPVLPWAIAAVTAILAVISWVLPFLPEKESETTPADSFIALLVDEAGAEFTDGNAPDEVRFAKGRYQLTKGAVHVRFANGADVVMAAPAAFEIDDAFHIRLENGGLRAIAPPSAQGFTVATPGIDYEDLGTEFGISVNEDSGISELHVFDGQVDAKEPGSRKLMTSVMQGESVQFADGTLEPTGAPDVNRYLTPGSIGFLRWEHERSQFGKDPDLIGYYPFIKASTLRNEAEQAQTTDGTIHGARWVSGRWPGKGALLFDRDTDFVEIEIPGEFEELTMAAWLKLDRLDFSHTSIFDSNGWTDGDIHWQLTRSGTSWIAGFTENGRKVVAPSKIVPTNEWVHLTAMISRKTGLSSVYLNGQPAGVQQISKQTLIKPGLGRIGNWLWDKEWPYVPIRALRGRIDEFAIWKRALTETEVKELVDKGKPAALWTMQTK